MSNASTTASTNRCGHDRSRGNSKHTRGENERFLIWTRQSNVRKHGRRYETKNCSQVVTKNRKQRRLLEFKETNQNTQEVKNEHFLIRTRQSNVRKHGRRDEHNIAVRRLQKMENGDGSRDQFKLSTVLAQQRAAKQTR